MDWSNSIGPLKGVYRGRGEVMEAWEAWRAAWSGVTWEPREVIELGGGHLVVVTHIRMRGHGSGVEVEAGGALLWTFRDALAESVKLYQSKEEALAAAES